jgi:hypothetical protein
MKINHLDFKKQEAQLYDKIRELSEEFDRENKAGQDTTDIIQKLGAVLEEFLVFRNSQ